MNKVLLVVSIAITSIGVPSFALMSSESGSLPTPVVQEPVIFDEEISILDAVNSFSAPNTIAQSMKAAQPAPNVTIGDDGKIYVLYQDTVDEETN